METSYDVSVWAIETRKHAKSKPTYRVTWVVARKRPPFRKTLKGKEQARSFHNELTRAARRGEAFRLSDGLPVSMARKTDSATCFEFAKQYVDTRWNDVSPGHRRNIVDAMATIVAATFSTTRGQPAAKSVRKVLRLALNPRTRSEASTAEFRPTLQWIEKNSASVAILGEHDGLQKVLTAIGQGMDGTPAADATKRRKRATLTHALDYAVNPRGLLLRNPLHEFKQLSSARAKPTRRVDRRVVVNPIQARTLLRTAMELSEPARRLVAFYATIYYASLRPEETANLRETDLAIPAEGWGDLHLHGSMPEQGPAWSDSGERTEVQPLKHRAPGDGRTVPCHPELTELLHWHMKTYGTTKDGRLFRGSRTDGRVSSASYGKVWDKVRAATFTPEVYASPLAATPYALRHACVSTWLAAGTEPTKVAEWAGHSVAILLDVYAKCLDGGQVETRDRIDGILRPRPQNRPAEPDELDAPREHGGSEERQTGDDGETQ